MRITARVMQAAAVAALAVLAVGCGSSGDSGSNGSGVIDQVININWGAEPPSVDPGLATDTTSGSSRVDTKPLIRSTALPRLRT